MLSNAYFIYIKKLLFKNGAWMRFVAYKFIPPGGYI